MRIVGETSVVCVCVCGGGGGGVRLYPSFQLLTMMTNVAAILLWLLFEGSDISNRFLDFTWISREFLDFIWISGLATCF